MIFSDYVSIFDLSPNEFSIYWWLAWINYYVGCCKIGHLCLFVLFLKNIPSQPTTFCLFYHYGFTDSLTQYIRIHYHLYAFWCSNCPSLISASPFKPTHMLFWHAFIGFVHSFALWNKSCFTHFVFSLPHTENQFKSVLRNLPHSSLIK